MLRRPRQPPPIGAAPRTRRGGRRWTSAASLAAVALTCSPVLVHAAPPDPSAAEPSDAPGSTDGAGSAGTANGGEAVDVADGAGDRTTSTRSDARPTAPVPSPDTDAKIQPSAAGEGGDPRRASSPGGVGNVVDADDPDAQKATDELEGEQLDDDLPPGVPERMAPMQAAAWWTMFGAVTLGATGGVFAGLAEREEDRGRRLQRTFDAETGARLSFAEVEDDYDTAVRRGTAFAWTSRGLLIAGGALLVTSVALFGVEAKRRRDEEGQRGRGPRRRARVKRVGPGFVEVAF